MRFVIKGTLQIQLHNHWSDTKYTKTEEHWFPCFRPGLAERRASAAAKEMTAHGLSWDIVDVWWDK